ncbi:hypothetical protein PABG_11580 [Paracoccidioides brasiliensis Pb03]|uniref:Uncharacterized protein n=2 Tax=Paracoccidioides brasiliensis TaxID=121759 RepID=A0A0A0HXH3_PARBD|nr:uncharacterized protein PADG_11209 [Paracoccidioides brasiliensis Pb18]KGM92751.1 hypothetical protein PADG_11209 [Paracoccidioides brasiliensis Pb18]KGY15587.1 hypothetical protein PABG_11580 [Paracoccidioides brasiliensis Pb03]ODH38850.1 hypothetical protein ACO22_02163 [Paracoccidioides brasiliensis]
MDHKRYGTCDRLDGMAENDHDGNKEKVKFTTSSIVGRKLRDKQEYHDRSPCGRRGVKREDEEELERVPLAIESD